VIKRTTPCRRGGAARIRWKPGKAAFCGSAAVTGRTGRVCVGSQTGRLRQPAAREGWGPNNTPDAEETDTRKGWPEQGLQKSSNDKTLGRAPWAISRAISSRKQLSAELGVRGHDYGTRAFKALRYGSHGRLVGTPHGPMVQTPGCETCCGDSSGELLIQPICMPSLARPALATLDKEQPQMQTPGSISWETWPAEPHHEVPAWMEP
jgi:hypothetical protein